MTSNKTTHISNKSTKIGIYRNNNEAITSPFDILNDSALPVAAGAQNVSGPDQTTS